MLRGVTTYAEVLRHPRFRTIFVARGLSITAETLRILALSVLVFAVTGSPLLGALAFGAGFLPQALGGVVLGPLADRLPARRLIVGGYLLEAATAGLLAVGLPVGASLLLVAGVAAVTPVVNGAAGRVVADELTGDAYVLGRSLTSMSSSAAQLLGLAAGGAAVAALGARHALLVAAVLHLVGACLATSLKSTVAERRRASGRLRLDRTIWRLMLAQWLPPAFVAGAEGLIVAYAGGRHFAPGWYAVLMGCLPIGMLVGDLLVGRLLRPSTRERLVVPLIALMGLPLVGFAAEPGVGFSSCLLLLCGLGFAYGLGLQRPFLDALPQDGQGQAFGLLGSGSMTLQGVGPACFGSVAAGIGTGGAIALAGGAAALTAGWILTWHPPASPVPAATTQTVKISAR